MIAASKTRERQPRGHWLQHIAALLLTMATAASAAPNAPIRARPLPPGEQPALSYWPFAPHPDDSTPLLTRIDIDARVAPAGCGPLTWSAHPVPGAIAAGPFCVAVIDGLAAPLLVVGRPGGAPYILAPGALTASADAVQVDAPQAARPAVTEAVRRWAAAPGGAR